MNDLLVIMPATQEYGLMRQYIGQLEAAGIDYHVAHLSDIPNANAGGTHDYALDFYKTCARLFGNYKKVIFSDAFDVLFYGTKEEVIAKIPNDYVLCAAERNCYPDQRLAESISGPTPWRFANGGLTAGTPANFIAWVGEIEKNPHYQPQGLNQAFLNLLLSENSPIVHLDRSTRLFYCMYLDRGEFDWSDGLPFNKLCCTFPNFVHFNGKSFHPGILAAREVAL